MGLPPEDWAGGGGWTDDSVDATKCILLLVAAVVVGVELAATTGRETTKRTESIATDRSMGFLDILCEKLLLECMSTVGDGGMESDSCVDERYTERR